MGSFCTSLNIKFAVDTRVAGCYPEARCRLIREDAAREHRSSWEPVTSATKPCPAAGSAGTCFSASSRAQVSNPPRIPSSRTAGGLLGRRHTYQYVLGNGRTGLKLASGATLPSTTWTGSCEASGWNAAAT